MRGVPGNRHPYRDLRPDSSGRLALWRNSEVNSIRLRGLRGFVAFFAPLRETKDSHAKPPRRKEDRKVRFISKISCQKKQRFYYKGTKYYVMASHIA